MRTEGTLVPQFPRTVGRCERPSLWPVAAAQNPPVPAAQVHSLVLQSFLSAYCAPALGEY